MSMSNHEISVAADKAADVIEERGHTKNELMDCNGSVCIRGALLETLTGNALNTGMNPPDLDILHPVFDYLDLEPVSSNSPFGETRFNKLRAVVYWNNAEERTQEEVVQVLRDVATKYRDDAMHA